jgi:hypothetical protein
MNPDKVIIQLDLGENDSEFEYSNEDEIKNHCGETEKERYDRILKEVNDEKIKLESLYIPFSTIPQRHKFWISIIYGKIELLNVYHYDTYLGNGIKDTEKISYSDSDMWIAKFKILKINGIHTSPLYSFLKESKPLKKRDGYPKLHEVWTENHTGNKVLITRVNDIEAWFDDNVYISYKQVLSLESKSDNIIIRNDIDVTTFLLYFTKVTEKIEECNSYIK